MSKHTATVVMDTDTNVVTVTVNGENYFGSVDRAVMVFELFLTQVDNTDTVEAVNDILATLRELQQVQEIRDRHALRMAQGQARRTDNDE
jgi:uncharacterized protein YbcV (DUF1398 family)